jgi:hypothetical protein
MAIRAKAPAHTSASRAAIWAGRKLLIATATIVQSAKDAEAHPQRAADTGQYVDNKIPHANVAAARARGARGWVFIGER